jgi:hypothetical protein
MSEGPWSIQVEPSVLLPGRTAKVTLQYTPARDHEARSATAALRCVERYRYDRSESTVGAGGRMTSHTVTHTDHDELSRSEVTLSGPARYARGQQVAWTFTVEVPGLGPASFEGEALRCDWTIEVRLDVPMGFDVSLVQPVHVAQPMALLRAGVVDLGEYGLFDEAPVNVDAHPAQIRLEPVPVNLQAPFTGVFTVETDPPISVQEVRLELRVEVQVTVSGGHHEVIVAGLGHLATEAGTFGGKLAAHQFSADAPGAWLPSVDLPHGRARGSFHVIAAVAMSPDTHYARDIALATTADL